MKTINLDYEEMERICLSPEESLIPPQQRYFFQDNGAKILAVAHCDFVCPSKHPDFATYMYKGERVIRSETLDDRLGVYIITKLLPSLGVKVDILLTTDEETGNSSAKEFVTNKKYNWIFSFDRRGIDVVGYRYENKEFEESLKLATGLKFGHGSFSDIVVLDSLGVKGLNFGTGYYREHTDDCYAVDTDIKIGVKHFLSFYRLYRNKKFVHVTPPPPLPVVYKYGYYDEDGRWISTWNSATRTYDNPEELQKSETVTSQSSGKVLLPSSTTVTAGMYKHCDGCKFWTKVTYIPMLDKCLCDICIRMVDGVIEDELEYGYTMPHILCADVTQRCQLCGISGGEETLYETKIPLDGRDSGVYQNKILCALDLKWISENVNSPVFMKSLAFMDDKPFK